MGSGSFVGLLPLIYKYLSILDVDAEVLSQIRSYLQLIENRANGASPTPARAIRDFVKSHPLYQQDSKISPELCYELLKHFSQF